jgi:hypothetical protein
LLWQNLSVFSQKSALAVKARRLFSLVKERKLQYLLPVFFFCSRMNERILYLDQTTDLAEITALLKNTKADVVVFVLPRKSLLFESIVNLQILRSTAEENGKELVIISLLAKGRQMCGIAGIESHATLEEWEKKIPGYTIDAEKNIPAERQEQGSIRHIPIQIANTSEEKHEKVNWRELLARPSWEALFGLLLFSLGLFWERPLKFARKKKPWKPLPT